MDIGQKILLFLLKAFGFVTVFWLSWIFMFRPMSFSNASSNVMSDYQQRQQAEMYSRQLQSAEEQLAVIDGQQKRMDAILTQNEQHIKRYEVVLQHWERQAEVRK